MFREIDVADLRGNPFDNGDPTLVSAGIEKNFNAAVVRWGSFGRIWDKPVAAVGLRPQSAAGKLVDEGDRFAVSFFSPEYKEALAAGGEKPGLPAKCYCSPLSFALALFLSKKQPETALTPYFLEGTVSFSQASLILICGKLCRIPLDKTGFITPDLMDKFYRQGDFHTLYLGEVLKILTSR